MNVRCVQWVKISFPKNKFSDETPHYRGVFLLDFFSIDQYMSDYTGQLKRTAVCNDDIGVFSFFQGTDTVCDADVLSRVDGDGTERIVFVHSGFDCKACAKREVVKRNYRCIGEDGDMASGVGKNSRSFPGLILKTDESVRKQTNS